MRFKLKIIKFDSIKYTITIHVESMATKELLATAKKLALKNKSVVITKESDDNEDKHIAKMITEGVKSGKVESSKKESFLKKARTLAK